MKLWSKEALVLGGVYSVLETPLFLWGGENFSDILFLLFVICLLMLCFNKVPKVLSQFVSNHPKTSYYLCSIGWIPYFIIIVSSILIISGYVIDYSDTAIKYSMGIISYPYTAMYLIIGSLVIAFIRTKINK